MLDLSRRKNDASFVLDLLRVIAAQMVCWFHAFAFFKVSWLRAPHLPAMQNFGVCIFFVLSGFLIAYTLTNNSSNDPEYGFREYAIDRVARIYSGWIPALIFVALVDVALVHAGVYDSYRSRSALVFIGNFFMLQGVPYTGMPLFGSGGPFWTLSIEFHIYLMVGAAFFILRGSSPLILLPVAIFCSALPLANLASSALLPLWLSGFAIAFILRQHANNVAMGVWVVLGLVSGVLLLRLFARGESTGSFIYALLSVLFAAITALALRTTFTIGPKLAGTVKCVHFLADYSYMLYLVHYTIMYAATRFVPLGRLRYAIAWIVIANLVAIVMAIPTEMQHRRLAAWLKAQLGGKRSVDRQIGAQTRHMIKS